MCISLSHDCFSPSPIRSGSAKCREWSRAHACPFSDGLVSYSAPQGQSRWPGVELKDHTYDGLHSQGQLYGGTGQLNDGTYGADNFRQDLGHGRGEHEQRSRAFGVGVEGTSAAAPDACWSDLISYRKWGGASCELKLWSWRKRDTRYGVT